MKPQFFIYDTMDDSDFRKKYPICTVTKVFHGSVEVIHPITSRPKIPPPEE